MKKIKLLSISLIIILFSSCKENSKSSNDSSNISSNIKTGVSITKDPRKSDDEHFGNIYVYKLSFSPSIVPTNTSAKISIRVFDNIKKKNRDFTIKTIPERDGYYKFYVASDQNKDVMDFDNQPYTLTVKTSDGKSVSYDDKFTNDLNDSN
ncbi:hypothetical protein B0A67_23945 [Flavobacterium aquidurense]|uniref:hypothetical protein n=1 Tax=Flavobacterium aquidurense TaxID=362413 RepID=UPI00091AAE8B|nr:hypothetical protein [Flavobacterium aquidurense]OXA65937.1 hypothetical protein B0A67_23945 [Flavobacterium aquidurense]SHH84834.1 hypothetical protein SAMN05444481_1344 [Flavobacterium frigidimaris]